MKIKHYKEGDKVTVSNDGVHWFKAFYSKYAPELNPTRPHFCYYDIPSYVKAWEHCKERNDD
jgi:hypothetical protein